MSIEQRKGIIDLFKIGMYVSLSICGYLLVDNYQDLKTSQHEMKQQMLENQQEVIKTTNEIQHRVIRIEYELKLK